MAQRTTITAVKTLLATNNDYNLRTNPDVQQHVDTASVIVDRVVTKALARGFTLSAGEQELIERWLSAHSYAMLDQTLSNKSTNGASGSYHGQTGLSLDGTKYGQMAKTLDPSGALATVGKINFASCAWLGVTPTEATEYEDW